MAGMAETVWRKGESVNGPQIEWQVEDGERGEQTIAQTPRPRKPSRWRWLSLAVVIVLGVSLGVLYYSIPAPPPLPATPTPLPTPTPRSLEAAIEQESQALARGDLNNFMAVQDTYDADWYQSQQASFEDWLRAPPGSPLYTVVNSGTLPSGKVWVDIEQWRQHTTYFRQTRFYRLRDTRWVRVRPDDSFWSGRTHANSTRHFDLLYPVEDAPYAQLVADRFERAYTVLCGDLSCLTVGNELPRVLTMTLVISPDSVLKTVDLGQSMTVTLPSPRAAGIYDHGGVAGDPYDTIAYDSLAQPVTRIGSGNTDRWLKTNDGELFLQAIVKWERQRVNDHVYAETFFVDLSGRLNRRPFPGDNSQAQQAYADRLRDEQLVPLKSLWHWPLNLPPSSNMLNVIHSETDAAIAFIEQEFTPAGVARFLNAIGKEDSFQDAVEAGLGLSYAVFEQRWQQWVGVGE